MSWPKSNQNGERDGPPCDFVGAGTTLSVARRAVRGHAFRQHALVFEGEEVPLRQAPPDEFQHKFNAFGKQQMSAAQRRAFTQGLLGDLASVARGDESAAALVPGHMTGDSGQPGDSSSWYLPEWDLSAGVVGLEEAAMVASVSVAPPTVVITPPFVPPRGFSPSEMSDFLRDRIGRCPSFIAASLGTADEATLFWLQTIAHLQKSIGIGLRTQLQNDLASDPTGRTAFERGLAEVDRLARRPLE